MCAAFCFTDLKESNLVPFLMQILPEETYRSHMAQNPANKLHQLTPRCCARLETFQQTIRNGLVQCLDGESMASFHNFDPFFLILSQSSTRTWSCRDTSSLMRLVEGEEMWEAPVPPQGVLSINWGGNKLKIVLSPVWCSRLRPTTDVTSRSRTCLRRILFCDEAHFWLNGYVNKQNCRIWSEANPQVYVETPLHPEKLTVWCALWAGRIIGPYFFKNDEGHKVTVNGDRYRAMITNLFIPELNNHDVQELWFQQDGATCHAARATIDLLKDMFGDRLISRFGPVNWPPRSCDLTPLDYFLWGYVKSLVYADKPQTLDYLEDNIRRVIADIRPQMLENVIENWTSRLNYIRASRGNHMPEIIFKM
ncbi:putative transposable element [Trichonephila clavipes]|nr:putative transposable element [Trichonephila clavipes]